MFLIDVIIGSGIFFFVNTVKSSTVYHKLLDLSTGTLGSLTVKYICSRMRGCGFESYPSSLVDHEARYLIVYQKFEVISKRQLSSMTVWYLHMYTHVTSTFENKICATCWATNANKLEQFSLQSGSLLLPVWTKLRKAIAFEKSDHLFDICKVPSIAKEYRKCVSH